MQLKETEFHEFKYRRIEIISNTDSGLLAVQYEPDRESPMPEFDRLSNDWMYQKQGDTYRIRIPKPRQRKVLRTIIVSKTSSNHYIIAYADTLGCVHAVAKTITSVHEMLLPLWQREL